MKEIILSAIIILFAREIAICQEKVDKQSSYKLHWYALENENDSIYWKNVNCNNIIIDFKPTVSIKSKEVSRFLRKMGLKKIVGKSVYPTQQNFFVFEVVNGNKNKILRITKEAKKIKSILYAEPEAIIKSKV